MEKSITYDFLNEEDVEETSNLIAYTFTHTEPMTKALGITQDEFYPFATSFCKKATDGETSLIARESGTSEVIGFLISEDLASAPPSNLNSVSGKFDPILALLQELDEQYVRSTLIKKGQAFHLFMGGVHPAYEQQQVFTTLVRQALRVAAHKRFVVAIGEATGLVSQHVLIDKLGFNCKYSIAYETYTYEGHCVFKRITDAASCMLLEKRLA